MGAARLVDRSPGAGRHDGLDHVPVVGRYTRGGGAVELAVKAALAEVQRALRSEGRQPLAASEQALLEQLWGDGLLLGRGGRPLGPCHTGQKTYQARVLEGGSRANVVGLRAEVLLGEDHVTFGSARQRGAADREDGDDE
jgi:hypothetical protein